MSSYQIVRDCAALLLGGLVLHGGDVTAGNGKIIDWRTVKSGEVVQEEPNAFDTAYLFVAMVGEDEAQAAFVARLAAFCASEL